MASPVTPMKQPPLDDFQNAIQTALCYEEINELKDVQRALARVRALIAQGLGKLGEPMPITIDMCQRIAAGIGLTLDDDEARDIAAVVTRAALTWSDR